MEFTGRNLEMIQEALALAIMEVHNQIATCPDVVEYAEDIEIHEQTLERLKKLLAKVNRAVEKEQK